MTTFTTSRRATLYYTNPQITVWISRWKTATSSSTIFNKVQDITEMIRSTHRLVPVGQSVVVVLQEPAAVFGQTLNGLQPQPTGQLLAVARPRFSAAVPAAASS